MGVPSEEQHTLLGSSAGKVHGRRVGAGQTRGCRGDTAQWVSPNLVLPLRVRPSGHPRAGVTSEGRTRGPGARGAPRGRPRGAAARPCHPGCEERQAPCWASQAAAGGPTRPCGVPAAQAGVEGPQGRRASWEHGPRLGACRRGAAPSNPPRPPRPLRSPSLLSPDDGAIRVWKNFADLEKNPEMVTAWQGLSDMLPTTRGGSPGAAPCCRPLRLPLGGATRRLGAPRPDVAGCPRLQPVSCPVLPESLCQADSRARTARVSCAGAPAARPATGP